MRILSVLLSTAATSCTTQRLAQFLSSAMYYSLVRYLWCGLYFIQGFRLCGYHSRVVTIMICSTFTKQKVCTYNVEYPPLSNPVLAGVNEVNEVKEEAGLEEVDDPVNKKYWLQQGIL